MENSNNNENRSSSSVELDKIYTIEDTLKAFETSEIDVETQEYDRTVVDISVIKNDVNRSFHFVKDKEKKEFYRSMLLDVLNSLRITYYQGMSEISSVILYFYTSSKVEKIFESHDTEEKVDTEFAMNTASAIDLEGMSIKDVLTKELKQKVLKVLIEIFHRKFSPLTENRFKEYKELNKVFLLLLAENKGITITEEYSLVYMNQVLSFFVNEFNNIDEKYFVLSLILSMPRNVLFIILYLFYDQISNKKQIVINKKTIYKEIVQLEPQFLELKDRIKKGKKPNPLKIFLTFVGVTLFVGIVSIAAKMLLNQSRDE